MKTTPALHRDVDASHKRAIDFKFQQYQTHRDARMQRERDMQRALVLTLVLLTLTALLAWSLSTERGREFCTLVSEILK